MSGFTIVTSRVAVLLKDNIDTDQIIPARFLKTTSREGLGDQLFYDWRYEAGGSARPDFVLNRPASRETAILLAGDNFGCGSSREHAAWALRQFGFRVIISTSFADIFRQNALKNGVLPVEVSPAAHARLQDWLTGQPDGMLTVDLPAQQLRLPGGEGIPFPVDAFSKTCLINGVDESGYLLSHSAAISEFENRPACSMAAPF